MRYLPRGNCHGEPARRVSNTRAGLRELFTAGPRICLALLIAGSLLATDADEPKHVTAVRYWSLDSVTRIAIQTDGDFQIRSDRLSNPDRIFFDLVGTKPALGKKFMTVIPVADKFVQKIRIAGQGDVTRVVLDLASNAEASTSRLQNPDRLIIELHRPGEESRKGAEESRTAGEQSRRAGQESRNAAEGSRQMGEESHRVVEEVRRPGEESRKAIDEPRRPSEPGKVTEAEVPRRPPVERRAFTMPPLSAARVSGPPQPDLVTPPAVDPAPQSAANAKLSSAALRASTSGITAKAYIPPAAPAPLSDSVSAAAPASPPEAAPKVALPAKHNSMGSQSMIRVLGLKVGRIVLDPGHGGHDTGTIGPKGLREKDLALDIAKRLGQLLEDRLGSEVIYTRTDDTFIPLERRTEIANEAKADLFLSIHANSSPMRSAAGVETYYLNFTTSRTALDVAARENAGSEQTIFELQDLLQKIALKDKVEESREFASRVQSAMSALMAKTDTRAKDRGVKRAPFVVLIGASMPSVLAEIGFISNPHDESIMKRVEYRDRVAEALYKGVASYANTLSHFQVAQRH